MGPGLTWLRHLDTENRWVWGMALNPTVMISQQAGK